MNSLKRILLSLLILNIPLSIGQAMQAQETQIVLTDDLFEAIHTIDLISLNIALAEGANIDTVDSNGKTPLIHASKIGNPRILRIVLAHNPDIDKQDHKGFTALMTAAQYGQKLVVEELLQHGADPELKNHQGYTSAELAMMKGHPSVVALLRMDKPVSSAS